MPFASARNGGKDHRRVPLHVLITCALMLSVLLPVSSSRLALAREGEGGAGTMATCRLDSGRTRIFVAPHGDDANPGTERRPVRTLYRARDLARCLRADMRADIVVSLAPGIYRMPTPLRLRPEDSGRNGHAIVYRARGGGDVVLSGGVRIAGWRKVGEVGGHAVYAARVPGIRELRHLVVNDARMRRARLDRPLRTRLWKRTERGYRQTDLDMRGWRNVRGIELLSNVQWRQYRCNVHAIEGDEIIMNPACWRLAYGTRKVPYMRMRIPDGIENALELLDRPGEWYFDPVAREVRLIPPRGTDMSRARVVAPLAETLVSIEGKPGRPVENVVFEGVIFADTTWLRPNSHGFVEKQANQLMRLKGEVGGAWNPPAAVEARFARRLRLDGNIFWRLGGMGVLFHSGVKDSVIDGNVFFDISSNAIQLMALNGIRITRPDSARVVERNTVSNNYVSNIGAEYPGAVGILALYVRDTRIVHNEIHHVPYTAISVGWGWGRPQKVMRNNKINRNLITNALTLLKDGGGIYTLGVQPGSEVAYNVVKYTRNTWPVSPYYFDQGSGGFDFHHNVSYGNPTSANFNKPFSIIKVHANYWEAEGLPSCRLGVKSATRDALKKPGPDGTIKGRIRCGLKPSWNEPPENVRKYVPPLFSTNFRIFRLSDVPAHILHEAGRRLAHRGREARFRELILERMDEIRRADMRLLERVLHEYRREHGAFPDTGGVFLGVSENGGGKLLFGPDGYIPGLAPGHVLILPEDPRGIYREWSGYLYRSDGKDFKLLSHVVGPARFPREGEPFFDPRRPGRAWALCSSAAVCARW